ncbi:hypothetical protein [Bacillus sp. SH5-2]|nr:hypothetical protein [Bacillus sp. SH5-2]
MNGNKDGVEDVSIKIAKKICFLLCRPYCRFKGRKSKELVILLE